MSDRKSNCWNYFKKENQFAVSCKKCLKMIKTSGNTSNMLKHLKIHGINLKNDKPELKVTDNEKGKNHLCAKNGEEMPKNAGMAQPLLSTSRQSQSPTISMCSDVSERSENENPIYKSFRTISAYSEGGSKHSQITNAIMYFICADNRPFYAVERRGFRRLMKEVAPLFKVPSREYFKMKIDQKYEIMFSLYKEKLKNVPFISITSDIWSEMMTTKSFLGITAHFVIDSKLEFIVIDVQELEERHTAEYISNEMRNSLTKWEIDINKIVAIITDSGANIKAAINMLVGKNHHIICFAHLINLVVDKALSEFEKMSEVITLVQNVVKWFKNSVNASDELRNRQRLNNVKEGNNKKLILDVKTRWNSTFYMLERFTELSQIVSEILFGKREAPPFPNANQLLLIKELTVVLKPLEFMTRELSGELYITASRIIPMINCAIHNYSTETNQDMQESKQLKSFILTEINKRFSSAEHVKPLCIATLLDPRFKNLHFRDPLALASTVSMVRSMLLSNTTINNSDTDISSIEENSKQSEGYDFWSFHKNLAHNKDNQQKAQGSIDELSLFLSSPPSPLSREPLKVWEEMKNMYPILYQIAMQYSCLVATSVPSERLFSDAGATVSQTRNRLLGNRIGKLIFLGSIPEEDWFN